MRDNRFRRQSGRFLVDGVRETARAIEAGFHVHGIYAASENWPPTLSDESPHDRRDWETVLGGCGLGRLRLVESELLGRFAYGQSQRGVVAEFSEKPLDLSTLTFGETPLVLVLDGIEKPGNVGAIYRCADAAGVDAVILSECLCDVFNPNAIRASLGTVFSVATGVGSRHEVRKFLEAASLRVVAARVEGAVPYWNAELQGGVAIIVGSEAHGLAEHWKGDAGLAVTAVQIPMLGSSDSLNVSVAAALLIFESRRQRHSQ